MGKTVFQFKQFSIDQDQCAMKVTTEACILGAWTEFPLPRRILDIGTGTGLLSLMFAQRYDCPIDGVEIEENAAKKAIQNFQNSHWYDRLTLFHQDVNAFAKSGEHEYDLIISNPPFFQSSLKSESNAKNLAIHSQALSQSDLLNVIDKLLSDRGQAFVLFPPTEMNAFISKAHSMDFHITRELEIYNRPGKEIFRKVINLGKHKPDGLISNKCFIRDREGNFDKDYLTMMKPYYLHL